MYSRLDTISACDGQIHRQLDAQTPQDGKDRAICIASHV